MIIQEHKHTFENPFFIATVVDNNDPEFSYRVKVRLDVLHETVEDKNLPWAAKVDSSFMGVGNTDTLHSVPEVGSKVLVLAIGNDPNSLVYLGNLYKKADVTPTGDDYLNCYGIYTKDGDYIKVDKIKKLLELIWSGKINISNATELTIKVNGPVSLDAQSVSVTSSSTVDVKASSVNVNASTTTVSGGPVTVTTGTTIGFNCLSSCLFTGATHVSNTSS